MTELGQTASHGAPVWPAAAPSEVTVQVRSASWWEADFFFCLQGSQK